MDDISRKQALMILPERFNKEATHMESLHEIHP
jgi:hypothetical protein